MGIATETTLRLFLEQIPAVAWATDRDLRFSWIVGSALKKLGLDGAQLVGTTLPELIARTHGRPVPVDAHRRALAGEAVRFEDEWAGRVGEVHLEPFRDPEGKIAGVVGISLDITERKHAEQELLALSRRLLEMQEAERRHIARELHDDFGQILTALKLGLQGEASTRESLALVDSAMERVRDLSLALRPSILDDLGLPAALRWLLARQSQQAGFEARLNVGSLRERLPPLLETACFRVVQEAVTNVARHAGAHRVDVELQAGRNSLQIRVHDDGRGFDVARARQRASAGASVGLLSMQERVSLAGGNLVIESARGRGTDVVATFPHSPEASP